jgi:hypothetical protein
VTAPKSPNLELLEGVVASPVLAAMRAASAQLSAIGVPHALVGGLAVGAWGYPRATKDVDFLVGDQAYEHHDGGLVTMRPGVPVQVAGVAIDFLSPAPDEDHLARALSPVAAITVPIAPIEVLVQLKLKSPRQKDLADVVELIKAGIDVSFVEASIAATARELLPKWAAAVVKARAEEAEG